MCTFRPGRCADLSPVVHAGAVTNAAGTSPRTRAHATGVMRAQRGSSPGQTPLACTCTCTLRRPSDFPPPSLSRCPRGSPSASVAASRSLRVLVRTRYYFDAVGHRVWVVQHLACQRHDDVLPVIARGGSGLPQHLLQRGQLVRRQRVAGGAVVLAQPTSPHPHPAAPPPHSPVAGGEVVPAHPTPPHPHPTRPARTHAPHGEQA